MGGAALLQNLATVHHHQGVGQHAGLGQIVRHQHHGNVDVLAQIGQQRIEVVAVHLVHRRKRLVQQQQARLAGQCARHRHPLLLPARQGSRAALLLIGTQAHALQPFARPRQPLRARQMQQGQGHVVEGTQVWHQRVLLEHHAHMPLAGGQKNAALGIAPHRIAHRHPANLRAHQPGQHAQERCFARARRPHQRQQLPGLAAETTLQRHGQGLIHLHLQPIKGDGRLGRDGRHQRHGTHRLTPNLADAKNDAATASSDSTSSSSAIWLADARSKPCTLS